MDIRKLNKKYRVILADPPWPYTNWKNNILGCDGSKGSDHYDCMSLEEIKAIPVQEVTEKDCILFLWATSPKLKQCIETVEAWGFDYKTVGFAWVKTCWGENGRPIFGMGYYTKSSIELVLLGTKGNIWGHKKKGTVGQVIAEPRREHSRKPEEARKRIEQLFDGPYLELFARQKRKGWDVWGNETEKFEAEEALF